MTAEQILKAVDETVPSEKYMKEVERLTEKSKKRDATISNSWVKGEPLFSYATRTRDFIFTKGGGCLTQICHSNMHALDNENELFPE